MRHLKSIDQQKPLFDRIILFLTLCIFIIVSCTGCVSIQYETHTIDPSIEMPSISMSMHLKDAASDTKGSDLFHGVSSRLSFRNTDGEFVPLTTSSQGTWVLKNAMAGEYQFEITDTSIMVNGKRQALQGNLSELFSLQSDQRATIKVILKKTPVGLILVIVVLIVFVIIWYLVANQDHLPKVPGLLVPPIPGITAPLLPKAAPLALMLLHLPPSPHGPVPLFIDGGVYMGASYPVASEPSAPEAIRFSPPMESTNVPVDSAIHASFSTPVNEASLQDHRSVSVQGSLSGPLHGTISYNPATLRMKFVADKKFTPGETITVTLMGAFIKDASGRSMALNYEWRFTVAD